MSGDTTSQIMVWDTVSQNIDLLPDGITMYSGSWITWSRDNLYLYWTNRSGLYKTDVETMITVQLRAFCWSRGYQLMQVSPDNERLLCAGALVGKGFSCRRVLSPATEIYYNTTGLFHTGAFAVCASDSTNPEGLSGAETITQGYG